jgi:TPP-dependent indolepyruvate ferredoxin oxidoreductase alpha subunit
LEPNLARKYGFPQILRFRVDLKHTVNQYRNKPINQVKQLKPKAMKAKNRILVVKESVAKKIAEGDYVKLGVLFKEDSGLVITKTENTLTVMVDDGCYDFVIEEDR